MRQEYGTYGNYVENNCEHYSKMKKFNEGIEDYSKKIQKLKNVLNNASGSEIEKVQDDLIECINILDDIHGAVLYRMHTMKLIAEKYDEKIAIWEGKIKRLTGYYGDLSDINNFNVKSLDYVNSNNLFYGKGGGYLSAGHWNEIEANIYEIPFGYYINANDGYAYLQTHVIYEKVKYTNPLKFEQNVGEGRCLFGEYRVHRIIL